jgi:hypothetical protein
LRQRGLSRCEAGFHLRDSSAQFDFRWLPLSLYIVLKSSDLLFQIAALTPRDQVRRRESGNVQRSNKSLRKVLDFGRREACTWLASVIGVPLRRIPVSNRTCPPVAAQAARL